MKLAWLMAFLLCTISFGQSGDPAMTTQPNASLQVAPNRTYHLARASARYDIDEVHHRVTGSIINTFSMIDKGARTVHFDTAVEKITEVKIDGKPAKSTFAGGLNVDVPDGPIGATHILSVQIEGSIFHWFTPTKADPNKAGIWAEGLAALPVAWAAPNDFTSTDIEATVPTAWTVISNGLQVSDKRAGAGRHTVSWKSDMPHANYLTSIIAGPYDTYRDTWQGRPLIMTCPKGYGDRLPYTFANTKDILSYFSDTLGVPYAWPKYGQTMIYDHPYGEEDVNATIYPMYWGAGNTTFLSLANAREGQHMFEWVIAHETAHQWFGDLVTCKDWGNTWLNEGMTTFMEMMYTRHSRGEQESLRQIEAYSQRYFKESAQYNRPIATNIFSNQGDAHTYYKGGTVMMSLRKMLGDAAFFRGLNRYLKRHYLGNVETNDLVEDMTDASGINLHPWFDQWIFRPGHPVISWNWFYDNAKKAVTIEVRQTQDTSKGIPVYDLPTHVGIVEASGLRREAIQLNAKSQTFTFAAPKAPNTVLFDPDHEFVREIPTMPWAPSEFASVFRLAPNPVDRAYALNKLLDNNPTPETLQMIVQELTTDKAPFPALVDTSKLASLKRQELKSFWIGELIHPNYKRRATAVTGLAGIAQGSADSVILRRYLGDNQPYVVVAAALRGLAALNFESVHEFAEKEARTSMSADVREAALDVLADAKAKGWMEAIFESASDSNIELIRLIGVDELKRIARDDPRLPTALKSALASSEPAVVASAMKTAALLKISV